MSDDELSSFNLLDFGWIIAYGLYANIIWNLCEEIQKLWDIH